ncbi:2'-5' RNA ligase [Rubellimicrobium thermophilum DSM 16684]|uniref:RNA 2',3'-cyclic phosphodiesterase n=1 Tax=Rubellimicrobium thermophilum DSM 16684 TaxID=1123069 RepID=S9R2V4_9RHOB|nr:RNA 2',3'-cyclic phosphodiesterase [Rubellimicrobium thermophilum]EPX86237.1 2'-5' RNA ligase [Rubellimicrobium thermophilum DSM 16684]
MRAFVAIAIPDPVVHALETVQQALPVGRAVDPDQLHLTLAFLGEQPLERLEAAHEALEEIALPAFELRLRGLGLFDEHRRPATLWAGVADDGALRGLRARVLGALHAAGLSLERRRFRPHVTLARLSALSAVEEERLAQFLGRWESFPSPPFTVRGFGLWRSTLRPSGAIHEELAHYPLV